VRTAGVERSTEIRNGLSYNFGSIFVRLTSGRDAGRRIYPTLKARALSIVIVSKECP
jgi:hypothetical protein